MRRQYVVSERKLKSGGTHKLYCFHVLKISFWFIRTNDVKKYMEDQKKDDHAQKNPMPKQGDNQSSTPKKDDSAKNAQ